MIEGLTADSGRLARGEITSTELVRHSLDRIAADRLGAFRVVRADAALAEAEAADRRRAEEKGPVPPLLGLPVAVKDDVDVAGETTPFGCEGAHQPKERDSEVVRRLREAGAVIVGKTTTSEIGQWPTGETLSFGAARNPWNPDHTPGGSSAGSAIAVATGMVSAAVGSDGAGSVRIPAAWSGLVGIKPQRGRISTWPHLDPFYGLAVYGPLARTVADAATLLDVLTGDHPEDIVCPPAPTGTFAEAAAREPGRLRIAVSFRTPIGVPAKVDPQIKAAVLRMAKVLKDLGHEVFSADPGYGLVGLSFLPRATTGVADWLDGVPDACPEPRTVTEAKLGKLIGSRFVDGAQRREPALGRRVGRIFDRADVVLTPTTAQLPLRIGSIDGKGWWTTGNAITAACPFCWAWNVLGWPGVNVPAGLSAEGLPIGAQLLGRENDEATLISLAAQLETVERWQDRRPAMADEAGQPVG